MIVFTYIVNDLLNNAEIISQYRGNALLQHAEEIPLDDTASSFFEDRAILTNYLKKGAAILMASLNAYAINLIDADGIEYEAYEWVNEVAADPPVEYSPEQIIIRLGMPDNWNTSLAYAMDEAIKDTLENYMLYRLGKAKGHNFESYLDDYKEGVSSIMMFANQRNTTTKRRYNLF